MRVSTSKERIKDLMNYFGYSASDLCRKTGIDKSALSNYINGKREPRQDQISKIVDPFGIEPAWLMGYDIGMFRKSNDEIMDEVVNVLNEKATKSALGNISAAEYDFILKYRKADETTKIVIERLLN